MIKNVVQTSLILFSFSGHPLFGRLADHVSLASDVQDFNSWRSKGLNCDFGHFGRVRSLDHENMSFHGQK